MTDLPGPVISATWLARHLDEVVLADVRWNISDGPLPDEYREGHIPTAIFVDLDADLSSPAGPGGRHPLPSAEAFADTRARLGFADRPVVAYDCGGGAIAARLWWMLDSLGVPAAVLDGGLSSWGGALETGWTDPTRVDVEPRPWPNERFVEDDEVLPAIDAGATHMDARSAERFAGTPNPIDTRPGHIPGSTSRPWQDNLDAEGNFRTAADLALELGPATHPDLVTSCGSGVTGCHTLLAARLAGNPGGRLYVGSWSEWSGDPDRPVSVDT